MYEPACPADKTYSRCFCRAWGLACITAYRAYNDSSVLDLAEKVWMQASEHVITADDAAAGSHPNKTVNFSATCSGGAYFTVHLVTLELIY